MSSSLLTLLSGSAARTGSGVSATFELPPSLLKAIVVLLNVTAGGASSADKLDVFLQDSIDSSTWNDLMRFTQVLGDDPVKKFIAYLSFLGVNAAPMGAPTDGSMSAGVRLGPVANHLRVKYVITNTGAQTFTFGVAANLVR